ncbi:MAG TPA: 50S ribosomal protein L11 methyltransferase [Pyrinomonadaceae bacterium]|jgi:ribosomal protein L11 methyltransferase
MDNKQTKWYALEVTASAEAAEAIEFGLNELDALGTEINNLGKNKPETLTIVGYFNEQFADQIWRTELLKAVQIYGFSTAALKKAEWREVENQDWLAEWKKHWRPTETDRFVIAPTWERVEQNEKIVIRIEPSMAFGTGTHETTRLCLRAIETSYDGEMSFLDVGTGTGILAIAAAKFKIQNSKPKIVGCDTDEDSIKIAKENAELNETADIDFYVGSIREQTPAYDFVCANLTADVILPMLPLLVEKAKKTLVLSGILKEQERLVTDELNVLGVNDHRIETDGEWISVTIDNARRTTDS